MRFLKGFAGVAILFFSPNLVQASTFDRCGTVLAKMHETHAMPSVAKQLTDAAKSVLHDFRVARFGDKPDSFRIPSINSANGSHQSPTWKQRRVAQRVAGIIEDVKRGDLPEDQRPVTWSIAIEGREGIAKFLDEMKKVSEKVGQASKSETFLINALTCVSGFALLSTCVSPVVLAATVLVALKSSTYGGAFRSLLYMSDGIAFIDQSKRILKKIVPGKWYFNSWSRVVSEPLAKNLFESGIKGLLSVSRSRDVIEANERPLIESKKPLWVTTTVYVDELFDWPEGADEPRYVFTVRAAKKFPPYPVRVKKSVEEREELTELVPATVINPARKK